MSAFLSGQSYGKSNVRLTKVTRHADRHDLVELAIDVQLEGDFAASYLSGDNRKVVATDSMRNTVYALAADHPLVDPESFDSLRDLNFGIGALRPPVSAERLRAEIRRYDPEQAARVRDRVRHEAGCGEI